jgi:hypothetical protein
MQLDDPAVANWPAAQAVHASALLLEEYWPAAHGAHADTFTWPEEGLALPAWQAMQTVEVATGENWPELQEMHGPPFDLV